MIRSNSTSSAVFAGCLWLLALLLTTTSAHSQSMTRIYTQEIRNLYRQGKQLVQQKAYKRAILKFKAALALVDQSLSRLKSPKDRQAMQKRKAGFLYVIARTYHYDKQLSQAFMYYQQSLVSGAKGKTAVLATSRMHQLRPKVLVSVSLATDPAGADIQLVDQLNKTTKGHTPYQGSLPPGTYRLVLAKAGFKVFQKSIVIQPGNAYKASFSLRRVMVSLELRSVPAGAAVVLQETESQRRYTGVTPLRMQLPPGQYSLQLQLKGHTPRRAILQLKATQTQLQREFTLARIPTRRPPPPVAARPVKPLPPLPHPKRKAARAAGWTTLIVAAAAGGGSAALYFLANDAIEQFNARAGKTANQSQSDAIYGDYTRGSGMRIAAHVTVGVAAVAAVTAISMFIWNGGPQPTRKPLLPGPKPPVRAHSLLR